MFQCAWPGASRTLAAPERAWHSGLPGGMGPGARPRAPPHACWVGSSGVAPADRAVTVARVLKAGRLEAGWLCKSHSFLLGSLVWFAVPSEVPHDKGLQSTKGHLGKHRL